MLYGQNSPATKQSESVPLKLENNRPKIIFGGLWTPPCPSSHTTGWPWWWWCLTIQTVSAKIGSVA